MQTCVVTITNRLGLHARAAARLVRLAAGYQSAISLARRDGSGARADAKSILNVLMLAAARHTELEIVIEGADEQEALAAVCELIANKFGEE
ncbi:MAG: HPr family phosphocarrier protein [Blastocatellia bacterium]